MGEVDSSEAGRPEVDYTRLPSELSPLNLHAYLQNAFGACGCSELDEMIKAIIRLLEWHDGDKATKYEDVYWDGAGVFYLLAGLLDNLGLAEHGTSIRYPWLTEDGKRLLAALKEHSAEAIDEASGEAYDGCWYGDS